MIQSMTGFGTADGPLGSGRVAVELRTVNHRFFNPSLKLPSRLQRWEPEVRDALRRRIARGHVTLSARFERAAALGSVIDEGKVREYAAQLRALRDSAGLDGPVDLATVLRLPDVLRAASEEDGVAVGNDGTVEELLAVIDRAADALATMRRGEGERMAEELAARLRVMDAAMLRIAARAPERVVEQRDRLRAAVRELTDGMAIDEQRIAQEIALLADRVDIQEEVARFNTHVAAFREAIAADDGDAVGKRLGFLLQEMLREANTTGSKGNDAAVVRDVLVIKEELERVREQVENVE